MPIIHIMHINSGVLKFRDGCSLLQELQRYVSKQRQQEASVQGAEVRQPMVLRYPMPYPQDPSPPPLVPQRPAELQYGNPYSTDAKRGGRNSEFSQSCFKFSLKAASAAC